MKLVINFYWLSVKNTEIWFLNSGNVRLKFIQLLLSKDKKRFKINLSRAFKSAKVFNAVTRAKGLRAREETEMRFINYPLFSCARQLISVFATSICIQFFTLVGSSSNMHTSHSRALPKIFCLTRVRSHLGLFGWGWGVKTLLKQKTSRREEKEFEITN